MEAALGSALLRSPRRIGHGLMDWWFWVAFVLFGIALVFVGGDV